VLCAAIALCVMMSGWLSDHGYSAAQRDAVLGYVRHESGFQPDVIGRNGVCLFQHAGSRRRAVLALGYGRCPPWQAQMEFADRELRTTFRGFWTARDPVAHMRECFGRGRADP
jgi:hypothetical protein